jgi:hypothetical protein
VCHQRTESRCKKRSDRFAEKLESALAQAHLRNLALESLIEVAEKYYQVDLKKNLARRCRNAPRKSEERWSEDQKHEFAISLELLGRHSTRRGNKFVDGH